MYKKNILVGVILGVGLALMGSTLCPAEEITLTTYYPSPSGVYQSLRLHPASSSNISNCNSKTEGLMYYDENDHTIKVCGPNDDGLGYEWQESSGTYWTQEDNNLYATDTDWNVGIGTTSPASKLSVGSSGSSRYAVSVENPSSNAGGAIYATRAPLSGSASWGYGIAGRCQGGRHGYQNGVLGRAYGSSPYSSGRRKGVYGVAGNAHVNSGVAGYLRGSNAGTGVFGADTSGDDRHLLRTGQWAGFFDGRGYFKSNVGIGTTSPGYALEVAGDVGAEAFYYYSDIALKENVNIIDNALANVLQLEGVSFNWKNNKEASIGLIAQEVEKIFPEAVTEKNGFKSVDYARLVSPVIEAVKEQQNQIEELKAEIEQLKNQGR